MTTPDSVWIEARIERIPFDTCWHWVGALNSQGYGVAKGPKNTAAHRVVYELYRGPIPAGLTLDHLCRVHDCVNPAHLEPVTIWENTRRGTGPAAVNYRRTFCEYGHPLTPGNLRLFKNKFGNYARYCIECTNDRSREDWRKDHPEWDGITQANPRGDYHRWGQHHAMAKLTADQVREIRTGALTRRAYAEKFGVSKGCINSIVTGKTWRYLDMVDGDGVISVANTQNTQTGEVGK